MSTISDIPSTWRRACLGPSLDYPLATLKEYGQVPTETMGVFLIWYDGFNLAAKRAWLAENFTLPPKLYTRFVWQSYAFQTQKQFTGLVFSFTNENEAMLFKLRWLHQPD